MFNSLLAITSLFKLIEKLGEQYGVVGTLAVSGTINPQSMSIAEKLGNTANDA